MQRNALNRLKSVAPAFAAMMAISNLAWAADQRPAPLRGDLTIGGTGTALATMQRLADEFKGRHSGVQAKVLSSLGSGGGIKAVLAGQLTVSVSSRPLTKAEQGKSVVAREIAKTPFVFATSQKNPINNVTLDELARLYAGKITSWPDGTLVRPVLRPFTDIDTQITKDMSPALAEAIDAAHRRQGKNIAVTDTDCADELEKIPGSIGASTLSLIQSEHRRLKVLSVDGIAPTLENAAAHKYPYVKTIYLVMPADPSPIAHAFARFIDSASGRAILAQTGNIPSADEK